MNQAIIELTAPDISCEKCKAHIERYLASHPGIEQARRHWIPGHTRVETVAWVRKARFAPNQIMVISM
jgi:copper chaperone CopZ